MLSDFRASAEGTDPEIKFRSLTDAYLKFAHDRFQLYSFVVQSRIPAKYGSKAGKEVWNLLLEAASAVSGLPDDTAAAVATWSFLHGYATLEHSGAFGASGPKGGLERGIEAFLSNFRISARHGRRQRPPQANDSRGGKKPKTNVRSL